MEGTPPQQRGWQAKKEAWLKLVDDKARAAVSRLDDHEQCIFWTQAPDDFRCARNPSVCALQGWAFLAATP